MVPITEEEKNGPLYKYYIREMAKPDPAKYIEDPLDPEILHRPEDMNKLFDPGYLPCEQGYGHLPDGGAVLENLVDMPGVTPEMFDFWFAWHPLDPMRYKIWNPEQHYYCMTMNPEIANNKALSYRERLWNTTHDIWEDCNMGKQHIHISFRNPLDIGFDPEKYATFGGTIVCSGNEMGGLMVHFLRPTERGSELRSRFWMGYGIIDGKPKKLIPDGAPPFPLAPVKALFFHNIAEFTNLAAILPEVYAEFHEEFDH